MPKITANVYCDKMNCFGHDGKCKCNALTEAPTGTCPFFKTRQQVEEGRKKAHDRLVALGRNDLIKKYEHNPYRKGQW